MADENQRVLRVVMIPWLAHGHIAPFLELAKSLATHGLQIFFVSTPLNIKRIKPQMGNTLGIDLVELAMPSVEGLPAGVESTADVGKEGGGGGVLIPLLIQAMDLLEKPFEALLQQLSPDMVIHDLMPYWVPRVGAKLPNPIPTIAFLVLGVASISFLLGQLDIVPGNPTAEDLTVSPPRFPSPIFQQHLFEARRAKGLFHKQKDGLSVVDRSRISVRESWAVACNTCVELEGVYVEYLQSLGKRPAFPVGLLMPKLPPLPADDICLQWLDRQPAASVVLLSFGSEYILTHQQLAAIAMGLQESSASFLWVLPAGNDLLPGFQDQIRMSQLQFPHHRNDNVEPRSKLSESKVSLPSKKLMLCAPLKLGKESLNWFAYNSSLFSFLEPPSPWEIEPWTMCKAPTDSRMLPENMSIFDRRRE